MAPMSSTADGFCKFQITDVEKLLNNGEENKKLFDSGKYEEMDRRKSDSFMADFIVCQIRVYPMGEGKLDMYLNVIDRKEVKIRKFGFALLLQDHNDQSKWFFGADSAKLGNEAAFKDFKPNNLAVALGHKMAYMGTLNRSERRKASKGDTIVLRVVVQFLVDSKFKPSWMIGNGKTEDIHFVVDGITFPANRAVLAARAPSLKLPDPPQQGRNRAPPLQRMSIANMKAATLKYLLHFIYAKSLPPKAGIIADEPNYEDLACAAQVFQLQRLQNLCEKKLTKEKIRRASDNAKRNGYHAIRTI